MTAICATKAEKEKTVAAETARLKRAWAELKLETMEKRALTNEDFQTLADFNLTRQEVYSEIVSGSDKLAAPHRLFIGIAYAHTAAIRNRLPIKMATYKPEVVQKAVEGAKPKPLIIHRAEYKNLEGTRKVSAAHRNLLRALFRDYVSLSATLSGQKKQRLMDRTHIDIDWRIFSEQRSPNWHSDGTATDKHGALSLIGRINLPPEFQRENGTEFTADNNSVYAMATRTLNSQGQAVKGTIHRSSPVNTPSPSLFLRMGCG